MPWIRAVSVLGVVALGGLLGRACYFSGAPDVKGEVMGRRECPKIRQEPRMPSEIPLSGDIINIPEFHDCQRFIVYGEDRATYDEPYAVFASARLDKLDSVSRAHRDSMIPAATILVDGGSTYSSLGIAQRLTCLYMWREGADWKARTLPSDVDNGKCTGKLARRPARSGELDLEVRATSFSGLSEADYPPVARWDWDEKHRAYYVSIKCGAAWCEVGHPGFVSSPNLPDPGGSAQARRVVLVKGWYDRQYLATPKGAPVTPSKVEGIITPNPGLDDFDDSDFLPGNWIPVATVSLSGPSPDYKEKFGWDQRARMLLCNGTRSDCFGGFRAYVLWWTLPRCSSDVEWWVRTVASDGSTKERCVYRWDMGAEHRVIGTARFRWMDKDETSWKRCTNGCCEVH